MAQDSERDAALEATLEAIFGALEVIVKVMSRIPHLRTDLATGFAVYAEGAKENGRHEAMIDLYAHLARSAEEGPVTD